MHRIHQDKTQMLTDTAENCGDLPKQNESQTNRCTPRHSIVETVKVKYIERDFKDSKREIENHK